MSQTKNVTVQVGPLTLNTHRPLSDRNVSSAVYWWPALANAHRADAWALLNVSERKAVLSGIGASACNFRAEFKVDAESPATRTWRVQYASPSR